MWILLSESILVGFITFVIGTIIFNFSINKNNKEENKNKPKCINLAFFITGFVLHVLLESAGFNKWYCDKKTLTCYRSLSKALAN